MIIKNKTRIKLTVICAKIAEKEEILKVLKEIKSLLEPKPPRSSKEKKGIINEFLEFLTFPLRNTKI